MQSIITRAQQILLDPKGTWPRIEAEPATPASLFNPYLFVIAAVSAVATFISLSLIGVGGFGVRIRVPLFTGIVQMIVGFGLSLAIVYLMSLLINALAPTFGGQKNALNALKLAVYASTASLLGAVLGLLPYIGWLLSLAAALYSIYLIYTGLPVLMKNPPGNSILYTLLLMVAGFVLMLILTLVMSVFMPSGDMVGAAGDGPAVTISTPQGKVEIDTGKLEEMAKRMEAAGKQMEDAQKSGDAAAAGAAAAAAMSAITGGAKREAVPAAQLKAMLPDTAAGLARESFEAQSNNAMGFGMSEAKARYGKGARRVSLSITDAGALGGLASLAGWMNLTTDRENDTEVERVGKQGQRTVRELYRKDGSHAEYTVVLANGILVDAKGDGVSADEVRALVQGLDLAKLEAVK